MDFGSVIRGRLKELGFEQKDLAAAAQVTESYISQLLSRKKAPPAPDRTDIYGKMEAFLKLPGDRLSKLADQQRKDELKRALGESPLPLHQEVRELVLRKCAPSREGQIRTLFEKEPCGALEHLEPAVAVISAGIDNRFGHPRPAVLDRLSERGIAVYRTDRHGTIRIRQQRAPLRPRPRCDRPPPRAGSPSCEVGP